jgi:hypothetical protein
MNLCTTPRTCLIKSYDDQDKEIRTVRFVAETNVTAQFAEQLAERLAYIEALHAGTKTHLLKVKSLEGIELAARSVQELKLAMGFLGR